MTMRRAARQTEHEGRIRTMLVLIEVRLDRENKTAADWAAIRKTIAQLSDAVQKAEAACGKPVYGRDGSIVVRGEALAFTARRGTLRTLTNEASVTCEGCDRVLIASALTLGATDLHGARRPVLKCTHCASAYIAESAAAVRS